MAPGGCTWSPAGRARGPARSAACSPPASGNDARRRRETSPTASSRWRCAGTRCSTPAGRAPARDGRTPEQIDEVPAGARVTGRLRRHVADRIADGLAVAVASAGLLGWPAARAAFVVAVLPHLPDPARVAVLGIDEPRRGRPRWTRDPQTGTWTKLET